MDWSFLIKNKKSISVSTDTRNLPEGCVFVALKGANFDGNNFALQAIRQGAQYAIVDEDIEADDSLTHQLIRVDNSLLALQDLARAWRRQWGKTIIAITGTNGKTTTKELTAAVLATKYNVHFTKGNLNNQIGVPLTLLQLTSEHQLAIVEMGASHPGDISELVNIALPDCGLITNVGRAHLQGFGSFEGVIRTKGELYDYLRAHGGFIFRNLDNPYLEKIAGELNSVGYHTGIMPEDTHLVGDYNSENIQAAITVGEYFGVDNETAMSAIKAYIPSNNRSQLLKTEKNIVVVDAYNANPTSMQAALKSFFKHEHNYPMAFILAEMRELGEVSHLEHQNVVNLLAERKAENVLLVGKEFAATTSPYPVFNSTEDLRTYLQTHPFENKHILVKGSNGNHLDKILDLL